jgi:hypothetical protein
VHHADIGTSGTEHHRNAITNDVHDAPEQADPLLGRHRWKFAIGPADRDAVETEADDPFDIARQTCVIKRAVSLERRDRDVEQPTQPRVALRDVLHDNDFRVATNPQPATRRIGRSIMLSGRQPVSVTMTVSLTPTVNWPKTLKATGRWNVMPGRSSVVTPV